MPPVAFTVYQIRCDGTRRDEDQCRNVLFIEQDGKRYIECRICHKLHCIDDLPIYGQELIATIDKVDS